MQMTPEEQGMIHADRAYDMSGSRMIDSSQVQFILDSESKILKRFTAAILRCDIGSKGEFVPIKYKIQQVYIDKKTGQEKIGYAEVELAPLMNDLGIKDMKSYLESYLNINMYLGEHSVEEIAEMVKETMKAVLDTIYANYMEYEIRPKDLEQIRIIMLNYTYQAASRSKDGITNTLLTKTTSSIQHQVSKLDASEEKKGFFNWRTR